MKSFLFLKSLFSSLWEKFLFFLANSWWFFLFLVLLIIFWSVWLKYARLRYKKSLNWLTLEVLVYPSEKLSLQAMEQVFAGFHIALKSSFSFWEKYFLGLFQEWLRIDILAKENEISFLITLPEKFRLLIEKRIYAQYPEAEIRVVEHPLVKEGISLKEYEIWGSGFKFNKEDPYPILTYPYFSQNKEEERIDPLNNILEAISNFSKTALVCLSYFIKPTGNEWKKEGERIVKELAGAKEPKVMGPLEQFFEFLKNLLMAFWEVPTWQERGSGEPPNLSALTPGQRKIIEGIENKIAKPGFKTGLRIFYLDKKEVFDKSNIINLLGVFSHFNTQDMNAFLPDKKEGISLTKFKWLFKKRREEKKKEEFFQKIKENIFPASEMILNTEELATICHFPGIKIKAPTVRKIEIKKGKPPLNLPH